MTKRKVLVTGFDPFGGEALNPSALILEQLAQPEVQSRLHQAGVVLVTQKLPVVRRSAIEQCIVAIEKYQPDMVIMLGQAGGRPAISFEKVAINLDDFRIEDNAGNQPVDEPVVTDGPAAYFTTMPVKAMVQAVNGVGVPSEISYSAGTFVCNHLFYGVMHYLAQFNRNLSRSEQSDLHIRADFVHVPFLPEQTMGDGHKPSLTLTQMTEGICAAIVCAAVTGDDIRSQGGNLH